MPKKKVVRNTPDREALILKAALLYYKGGLTQGEVAERLGFSRPTVVRMLQQAKDTGLVQIKITKPVPQTLDFETELEAMLRADGLRQAVIVEDSGGSAVEAVAEAGALYLQERVRANHVLGVSWSTTTIKVPQYLKKEGVSPERIVQLGGHAAGGDRSSNAQAIAMRFGDIYDVPVEPLPAPVIVGSKQMRDGLNKDPVIRDTRRWTKACNFGIVGIGVVSKQSRYVEAGYLKAADFQRLAKKGVVGEVLANYYDIDGNAINAPWSDRTMTVALKELRQIENLVVIAAGAVKAAPVLGAIRAGILKVLIADTALAEALLELVSEHSIPNLRAL